MWLLGQIGGVLSSTTAIDLGAPWFRTHYATMAALAGVVIVPLLLLGVLQALYRQSASMLLRSVLVNVPLAVLLTAVAVTLVQLGLAVTDSLCAAVSGGSRPRRRPLHGHGGRRPRPDARPPASPGRRPSSSSSGGSPWWSAPSWSGSSCCCGRPPSTWPCCSCLWPWPGWPGRPSPTGAAGWSTPWPPWSCPSWSSWPSSAWPSAHWPAGTGSTPSGASASGGGFASVLGGAALLLLAALAPWSLFRLLPFLEAGAVGHLEGLSQRARHQAAAPATGLANVALRAAAAGSMATGPVGVVGVAAAGPAAAADRRRRGGRRAGRRRWRVRRRRVRTGSPTRSDRAGGDPGGGGSDGDDPAGRRLGRPAAVGAGRLDPA